MKKLLLSFGALLLASTVNYSSAQDCSGNRYKQEIFTEYDSIMNIKYGSNYKQDGVTNEDLYMDIFLPKNDNDNQRIAIVLAHGGSFIGGDKSDLYPQCRQLAKMGYVVATINYRLLDPSDPTIFTDVAGNFKKEVVRAIHDMKAAMRFMRKSIAESGNPYGIVDNIIISGGLSAGAIMANHMTYMDTPAKVPSDLQAYVTDQGGLEGNSGNPGYSSTPQMVLSMCGAILDTTWLEPHDQPFYGVHTQADSTVKYLYGSPNIGIPINVPLYGDSLIYKRAVGQGIPAHYKHYPTGAHCQFGPDYFEDMVGFTYDQLCVQQTLGIKSGDSRIYLSVYPNPVKTSFTIDIPGNKWQSQVQVVDMTGRVVYRTTIPEMQNVTTIDASTFGSGIYQVRIATNDGRVAVKKIVVE